MQASGRYPDYGNFDFSQSLRVLGYRGIFGRHLQPIRSERKIRLLARMYYRFGCMVHFVGLIRRLVGAAFLPADQLASAEWNRWIDVFCGSDPVGFEGLVIGQNAVKSDDMELRFS